jgi:hypothetical protein
MARLTRYAEAEEPLDAEALRASRRLEDDPRWQLAKRVATSRGFVKSRFLSDFILYVCEKHLLDRAGEITEQQIGEQVFRRPPGYSPGDDNIVRNYARLLRQRLDEYFTTGEGVEEVLRIAVPRGGYVPIFIEEDSVIGGSGSESPPPESTYSNSPLLTQPIPDHISDQSPDPQPGSALSTTPVRVLLALCAVLSVALVLSFMHNIHIKPRQTLSERFWSSFFSPARDTLLVPADSGLAIYHDLTHQSVPLGDYVGGNYAAHPAEAFGIDPALVKELGTRRYTSVVDLHLVSIISQLPTVVRDRFKVRYAREVQLDDLKESNVILLGAINANPWVELFQKDMNFQFENQPRTGTLVIHNLHPAAGEKSFYQTDEADPARTTFGVIAVTPNLSGTGHVLLIEGLNMAGTEAAADFLFSDASTPLLRQLFDSRGNLLSFEVLLETSNIGANAPRPRIVSQRIDHR